MKRKNKKLLISGKHFIVMCSIVTVLFSSCNRKLTVNDFFREVSEDKDYRKEATVGEFKLITQYRPSELICLSELAKGKNEFKFDKKIFDEELNKYDKSYYIDLTICANDGSNVMTKGVSNQAEYAARIGELTYLLNRDFYMMNGMDTIRALNCIFSNTYGNSPNAKFMFVFPKAQFKNSKVIKLVYDDKTFGIRDKVEFEYEADELNKKVPTIIE